LPEKRPVTSREPSTRAIRRPRNRLLAAIPEVEWLAIHPLLTTVPMRARQNLHKSGEPTRAVYFLNAGVASVTAVLFDGRLVEVATIGIEGMVGIEALFGDDPIAPGDSMIQVPEPDAEAEMMTVRAFRETLTSCDVFSALVGRYAQGLMAQMIQSTACNALHSVQQRCARWLLSTHDRVQKRDFRLSHEFLAVMLGVQRPTVSVVASALQQQGLIRYRHGVVSVTSRRGLEDASCECYRLMRSRFSQLMQ
jgi:CRP-like cAMP-binding protein